MGPPPGRRRRPVLFALIILLVLILHCSQYTVVTTTTTTTSADFNVVIPEICSSGGGESPVNISRIKEMVLLGIREDRPQLLLNIASPREICDKSSGLLEFLFEAKQENAGQMVGSLKPHLCETAATLLHSQGRHFASWTCPKMPGVVSIKPAPTDVILAINRLVKHLSWRKFAFAKLQSDKSPYCDEIGSLLEQQLNLDPDTNDSILILGKYEDVNLPQYTSIVEKLQGVFLCISYDHGFTHSPKTDKVKTPISSYHKGPLPLVLLPEWPLPLDVVMHSSSHHDQQQQASSSRSSSSIPVLALLSHPHPFNFKSAQSSSSSSPEPEEASRPSWESFAEFIPLEPMDKSSSSRQRILEPLLARLILRSMKVSMEYDAWKRMRENEVDDDDDQSEQNPIMDEDGRRRHNIKQGSKAVGAEQFHQFKALSFRFLVFKFEKDRWHPVVNLVPGDNLPLLGERHHHGHGLGPSGLLNRGNKSRQSMVEWVQIIAGIVGALILIAVLLGAANYAREKYQNHLYAVASTAATNNACATQKKLVPRTRSQGPYKLLLTSRDICFSTSVIPPSNKPVQQQPSEVGASNATTTTIATNQPNSLDPHHPHLSSFSRASSGEENSGGCGAVVVVAGSNSIGTSSEKPDLLKGSMGGMGVGVVGAAGAGTTGASMKKTMSIANMKNDSIILSENQARYKGDLVHLRKLSEPSSEPFEIKTKAMNVLETIHGLRHENLVGLIGVLTDGIPALVWEFCSRGSLHDIIRQQDIKLDWAFKLSLLTDLVRGMKYLHSSLVRVHGFLTSYNCVIDARWVLKITDYGVLSFHHTQGVPLLPRSNKELLWTAPELLREEGLRKHGTQPGDVYSFAIIMQEILVRGEPYCMLNITTEEILEKVRRPPPLIRPSVSKGVAPPEAINVMRQCWAEIPEMRPDFVVIHDHFKTLNHGRKANIVDTMFEMLEKYSNNLEELIRERTEQLDLERKKTEQLLNRMLPSTVAEKLKVGLPVDPEDFSEVTIYFSDIVGFTTISAYSTPFEVVDLLNDLYTTFDATINDYNVYKVETIGDAYMVVGGAPVRSPDHADQIATMALDLLYESGQFRIRHLPYTPLRLRIGIHTGPCCAGVVGLTMPRYCLFGDTVNTTSRMESTGAPWRIHISSSTKSKLESIGGYVIEYRGITDIKGKGKMPTYWLLGKDGFDKELPRPPPVTENHGLDEKSIIYGRTGIPPSSQQENLQLISKTGFRESRPNSQEGGGSIGGGNTLDPKGGPAFSILHAEAMRCLSPAEEVAHQLLNGRPAVRGLRRQFSLDQGSNYYLPPVPTTSRVPYRKTPSLEETVITDHHKFAHSTSSYHHQLSIEVPCSKSMFNQQTPTPSCSSTPSSSSAAAFTFNSNFSPKLLSHPNNTNNSPPPLSPSDINKASPQSSSPLSDNKELHPSSSPSANTKSSNKTSTLSPRTGRIFIKSTSLTRVEESPTQE